MRIINPPPHFESGTRVLLLKGRHKDGVMDPRSITRVSHDPDQYRRKLSELIDISRPGERIYVTAGPRDVRRASFIFRQKQLEAEQMGLTAFTYFYRSINARWASSLMKSEMKGCKVWLIDCDTPEQYHTAKRHFDPATGKGAFTVLRQYKTKNGHHFLVEPFNRNLVCETLYPCIHQNALALVGY